ncbi:MAG: sulfotransferase [Myxococcota bacterium]|jgi:hypothetical protein
MTDEALDPTPIEDRLLFLISSPRAGSTMLARMLGAHPDVHSPAEPHLLTPLAHLGYYNHVERAPYDPIIAREAVRTLVADLPGGEADYLKALRRYSDSLYADLLAPSGRRLLLDKTPAYALVLDFAARLYPRARYLVLTRNPMAIWCSYVESFFDGDFESAHRHNPLLERYVPAIARFLRDANVPKHAIRYEDLVRDPETLVPALCKWAGLTFTPAMIDYGSAGEVATGRGLGDPVTVARESRPTTASLSRWAKDLAGRPEAVAQCTRILASLDDADLETWGYSRAAMQTELDAVAGARGRSRRRPLSRHSLERKLLVGLRRNIQKNAFGRLIRRIRSACDVLLR